MIVLTRAQYLHLAQTEVQAYKTLRRRNQVPLFGSTIISPEHLFDDGADVVDDDVRQPYLPIDALMLTLCNDLARTGGADRALAHGLIQHNPDLLVTGIRRVEGGEEQAVWIADFAWQEVKSLSDHHMSHVGTYVDLMRWIVEYRFDDDGFRPFADVHRIMMVSLTRAIRRVREKGEEIGIQIESFLPVKPDTV